MWFGKESEYSYYYDQNKNSHQPFKIFWNKSFPDMSNGFCSFIIYGWDLLFKFWSIELLVIIGAISLIFWKNEKLRFINYKQMLELRTLQAFMEPNIQGVRQTRKNMELEMELAMTLLKHTHDKLDELVSFIKHKQNCRSCAYVARQIGEDLKSNQVDNCINWLQNLTTNNCTDGCSV